MVYRQPIGYRLEYCGWFSKISLILLALNGFQITLAEHDSIHLLRVERQDSTSIQKLHDVFSILARVVNSISLQEGFSDNSIKFEDLMAELLNIESGQLIPGFTEISMDAEDILIKLDKAYSLLSKLQNSPVRNSSQVKEGIEALEEMKKSLSHLKYDFNDTLTKLKTDFKEFVTYKNDYEMYFDTKVLEESSEVLTVLMNTEFDEKKVKLTSSLHNATNVFPNYITKLSDALDRLFDYEKRVGKFLAIRGPHIVMSTLSKIVATAEKYRNNFAVIASLPSKMTLLDAEIGLLLPIISDYNSFAVLRDCFNTLKLYVVSFEAKKLTFPTIAAGFSKGPTDFFSLKDDLRSEWFKNVISKGKNVDILEKSLTKVLALSEKMKTVGESWLKYQNITNISSLTSSFISVFDTLSNNGKTLSNKSDISSSIDVFSKALGPFKDINDSPMFDDFRKLQDYVNKSSAQASLLNKTIEKFIRLGKTDFRTTLYAVRGVIEKANNPSATEMFAIVEEIRNNTDFKKIFDLVNLAIKELEVFNWKELEAFIGSDVKWESLDLVKDSLKDTGLVETLEKLQGAKYDSDGIEKTLSFGSTARKVGTKDFNTLKLIVTTLDKLKTDLTAVKAVTAQFKKSRRRRSGLRKLEQSQNLATDVGNGVSALTKLVKVYEKRKIITSALEAQDPLVHSKASKAEPSWSEANRKALKDMPKQLDDLEKYATENIGSNDLMQLGKIFAKASNIRGAPVNTKNFKAKVFPALQTYPSESQIFSQLDNLDLDFGQHSINIRSASLALLPLRTYFDQIFGLERNATGESASRESDQSEASGGEVPWMWVGIGLAAFVIVVALVVLAISFGPKFLRGLKYEKILNDPETWILLAFTKENVPTNGFPNSAYFHLTRNDLAEFKKSLNKGAYVDAYVSDMHGEGSARTMLHQAVADDKPKFIEELIKHGACREKVDHDHRTPLKLAKDLKMTKCIKVFENYENKSFKISLPQPLLLEQYSIRIDQCAKINQSDDFETKFKKYMCHDESPSHTVVNVYTNGFLDVTEELLSSVFSSTMLMTKDWLTACVQDPSKLTNNRKYRVTELMYNGKRYKSLGKIKESYNLSKVPFLFGTKVMAYGMENNDMDKMLSASKRLGSDPNALGHTTLNPLAEKAYHREELLRNITIVRESRWDDSDDIRVNSDKTKFIFFKVNEFMDLILTFETKSEKLAAAEKKIKMAKYEKKGKKTKKNNKKKDLSKQKSKSDSGPGDSKGGSTTNTVKSESKMGSTTTKEGSSVTATTSMQSTLDKK